MRANSIFGKVSYGANHAFLTMSQEHLLLSLMEEEEEMGSFTCLGNFSVVCS